MGTWRKGRFSLSYICKDILEHNISGLCWGKAIAIYTKTQQRKKEESERLRGEGDQIEFIDLAFERWQVVGFRKQEEGKTFHKLHALKKNEHLWNRVLGVGSLTSR